MPAPRLQAPAEPAAAPPGVRIYAVGDIHGRADLLRRMFALIDADVAAAAPAIPVEIYLGDYVDRGPDSRGVVDLLIRRKRSPLVRALLGNHEHMLLDALGDPEAAALWRANGGATTLRSYGAPPGVPDNCAPLEIADLAAGLIRGRHLDFYRALEPSVDLGGYHFVHAGVRPGVPLDEQTMEDRLWIREPFLRSGDFFGRVVVHGHTPSRRPVIRANRIGIDTGAFASGMLTCLVLEGPERRFLTAAA